jgi:glucokinase
VYNVLAIDIGGTNFRLGLFDEQGRRLMVSEASTFRKGGKEWMLDQIRERCRGLMEKTDYPVRACGVSFGGPVDFKRQVATSLAVPDWKNFSFADWVKENLKLPCLLDNDANSGALGESRYGGGQGHDSMFYITLSTGVGGGWVVNHQLFRGDHCLAGEIGHLPVSEGGILCSCGATGCLETYCSGSAIAMRGREWATRRPDGVARMIELSGGIIENITAKAVFQAAAEGNIAATHIVQEAARYLARGLMAISRIVDPEIIILGGGVSLAGHALMGPLQKAIAELKGNSIPFLSHVELATLGDYSALYGAAELARELARPGVS